MNSAIPLSAGASRKTLLVTLADRAYIAQAKQLFSSVYWNAGWRGDYMLFAHEMPATELVWFRERGILVKECQSVNKNKLLWPHATAALSKFYLFTPEFKKWDNVVFLDADIIVRYSLEELAHVRGFHAVPEFHNRYLSDQFSTIDGNMSGWVSAIFPDEFDGRARAFNTGVMAFSTDVIAANSFDRLTGLFAAYHDVCRYAEQPLINLLFYKNWQPLDFFDNIFVPTMLQHYHLSPAHVDGRTLHFLGTADSSGTKKPWSPASPFFGEWQKNLERAEDIDLVHRPGQSYQSVRTVRIFGRWKKWLYLFYISAVKIFFDAYYFLDRQLGRCGILFRKLSK